MRDDSDPERLLLGQLRLPALSASMPTFDRVEVGSAQGAARQKELGAFYTPEPIATKLVEWAIRSGGDRVLDPSFGGLVFLNAARDRLASLGARDDQITKQLFGVDLDEGALAAAQLARKPWFDARSLVHADFFSVHPDRPIPRCDAVVGNPPYIRYQGFKASASAAHEVAERAGIPLTRLASSWAPFVIHATSFVGSGGRLAQVLPAELLHAQYASEIIDFLRARFHSVSIAVFEERVFPGALEEVVLLCADGRSDELPRADVRLHSFRAVADLELVDEAPSPQQQSAPPSRFDRSALLVQLLPARARAVYERVTSAPSVAPLSTIGSVDIGAVTGANSFFTLTAHQAAPLSPALVRRAVSKAAHIPGATLSKIEHREILDRGQRGLLFTADSQTSSAALKTAHNYLRRGVEAGIDQRYKCRTRDPWWAVPLPKAGVPDLLLTYCSSEFPRLVLNTACVLHTNTLHGVKLKDPSVAGALAACFYNSLTLLSVELMGRSYGGGVLKLEPTEAERVLIPPIAGVGDDLLADVDQCVRKRKLEAVLDLIDPIVLGGGLGLSGDEIECLRAGAERLRSRRRSRGQKAPAR